MSLTIWRYSLWTITVFVVIWIICLVSAVVGGKSVDKLRQPIRATDN